MTKDAAEAEPLFDQWAEIRLELAGAVHGDWVHAIYDLDVLCGDRDYAVALFRMVEDVIASLGELDLNIAPSTPEERKRFFAAYRGKW